MEIELNVPVKYRVCFNVIRCEPNYKQIPYSCCVDTLEGALVLLLEAQTAKPEYSWEVRTYFDVVAKT